MGFDENGNYTVSAERDSEKDAREKAGQPAPQQTGGQQNFPAFLRQAAGTGPSGGAAPAKPSFIRELLFGKWSVLLRVVLIGGLVAFMAVYAFTVAPDLIKGNKTELPPLFGKLMKVLDFLAR